MLIHAANAWAVISVAAADQSAKRFTGRDVSYGGVLTALILLFLVLSAWSPTADLAFFSLTSLCVAIAVVELGIGKALIVWLAATLLGLAYPGLQLVWPFVFFFGIYPLLRGLIDQKLARKAAFWLRHGVGLILLAVGITLFMLPLLNEWTGRIGSWLRFAVPPALAVLMLVYDYALTLLIQLYYRRIHNRSGH